jgi:hypothetical protein
MFYKGLLIGLLIAATILFVIEAIQKKSLTAAGLALVAIALAMVEGATK